MYKKLVLILIAGLFVSGCSIKQTVEQAEISNDAVLCIVENTDVRKGFLIEFKSALAAKNISHKVVDEKSIPSDCAWTATYVANWTWDLALYMSYAEIKIFHNGSLDGEATYDSRRGGANMNKFIDAEPKIHELVNELMQYKSAFLFTHRYG